MEDIVENIEFLRENLINNLYIKFYCENTRSISIDDVLTRISITVQHDLQIEHSSLKILFQNDSQRFAVVNSTVKVIVEPDLYFLALIYEEIAGKSREVSLNDLGAHVNRPTGTSSSSLSSILKKDNRFELQQSVSWIKKKDYGLAWANEIFEYLHRVRMSKQLNQLENDIKRPIACRTNLAILLHSDRRGRFFCEHEYVSLKGRSENPAVEWLDALYSYLKKNGEVRSSLASRIIPRPLGCNDDLLSLARSDDRFLIRGEVIFLRSTANDEDFSNNVFNYLSSLSSRACSMRQLQQVVSTSFDATQILGHLRSDRRFIAQPGLIALRDNDLSTTLLENLQGTGDIIVTVLDDAFDEDGDNVPVEIGVPFYKMVQIQNNLSYAAVIENSQVIGPSHPAATINFATLRQNTIRSKHTVTFRMLCQMNQLASYDLVLQLSFQVPSNDRPIQRGSRFQLQVISALHALLRPDAPAQRRAGTSSSRRRREIESRNQRNGSRNRRNRRSLEEATDGIRPQFSFSYEIRVENYPIPRYFFQNNLFVQKISENPSISEYTQFLSELLWLEELTQSDNMANYDIENARLIPHGPFLGLTVTGLAEKRPSLIKGDFVVACLGGSNYTGYIHQIMQNEVYLMFAPKFHEISRDRLCDICFVYPRRAMRLYHQTLGLIQFFYRQGQLSTPLVFPNLRNPLHAIQPAVTRTPEMQFNSRLNERQLIAVSNILKSNEISVPYIVFGPPGTGKSVTVVEAILQLAIRRDKKVLVTAPSNSACDGLLNSLKVHLKRDKLLRLNAYSRSAAEFSEDFLAYCNYNSSTQEFPFPIKEKFLEYDVVVATSSLAGKLYNYGIPFGHFDSVFVDECGYAMEPEVLSALLSVLNNQVTSHVVIAGDPKQLGPVVANKTAGRLGLGKSYLERILDTCHLYERNLEQFPDTSGYNPTYITKLVNCYRCHPDILHIPNEKFYFGDLIPSASFDVSHNMIGSSILLQPNFPIIFHGVHGENLQESNSPSWFNIIEIEIVKNYVDRLLDECGVRPREIGIIAPYHKQVQKLKRAIGTRTDEIEIGSCEQFQGREKRVIIISTVRSTTTADIFRLDEKYDLGFVSQPKRFNVALTRAQALLVVVGNPVVLMQDGNWRSLLMFCRDNNSYTGVDLPEPEEIEQNIANIQNLVEDLHILDEQSTNDEEDDNDNDDVSNSSDDSWQELQEP